MAKKEQQDFVVSDRRRFDPEGDRRENVDVAEEAAPAPPAAAPPAEAPPAQPQASKPAPPAQPEPQASPEQDEAESVPEQPTAEEHHATHEEYKATGKKLEQVFGPSPSGEGIPEMTFERLIESFYMTALIQLGALRQEGDSPRVDIIGARQTIDSINLLHDKTKGNLTDKEQSLLQNVLFELRMAWIEVMNAIATSASKGAAGKPQEKK